MSDLVSIIMPSFNTGEYIKEAIYSILNQTYINFELIIVDDKSSDNSVDIIKSIKDKRIKLLINESNKGAAYSRNRALKEAKGRWIAFLDSDDIWLPTKLEKQINFMINNNYYFTYSKYEEFNIDNNKPISIVSGPKKINKHKMFNFCYPGCLTVIYDTTKVGLIQIDESIKKNNDYAMWLKVIKYCNCYLFDEVLAKYRRGRTSSISTSKLNILIKWHFKLFKISERQNSFLAFINTLRNLFFGFMKKFIYVKKYKNSK